MVIKTEPKVPEGAPPTSEGEPVASAETPEQTVATPQETAEKPEGTEDILQGFDFEAAKERLGPDGLAIVLERLGVPQAKTETDVEFEERVRREVQSREDKATSRKLKAEASARRADEAKAAICELAEKGQAAGDSAFEKFGDAYAANRLWPTVRENLEQAARTWPRFAELPESIRSQPFFDSGYDTEEVAAAGLTRFADAVYELSRKGMVPESEAKAREKAAAEIERIQVLKTARGEVPPATGAPTGVRGLTFEELERLFASGEATSEQEAAYLEQRQRLGFR